MFQTTNQYLYMPFLFFVAWCSCDGGPESPLIGYEGVGQDTSLCPQDSQAPGQDRDPDRSGFSCNIVQPASLALRNLRYRQPWAQINGWREHLQALIGDYVGCNGDMI